MNAQMNKSLEYSFDVGIALTATLLQIHLPTFDLYGLTLKFAVLSGSMTYVFRAMRDEKLSTKDSFFNAFTGYTFGIYTAPALSRYFGFGEVIEYNLPCHYLSGGFGMWVWSIGWSIMKGANAEAWPIVKGWVFEVWDRVKSWIPQKKKNDDSPTDA